MKVALAQFGIRRKGRDPFAVGRDIEVGRSAPEPIAASLQGREMPTKNASAEDVQSTTMTRLSSVA